MPGWHRVDQVQLLTCWAAWLHFAPLPTSLPPFFLSSIPPFSIWPCSQGYTTKKEARYSQCLRSCKTFVDNYKHAHIHDFGKLVRLRLCSVGCLTVHEELAKGHALMTGAGVYSWLDRVVGGDRILFLSGWIKANIEGLKQTNKKAKKISKKNPTMLGKKTR